MEKRTDIDPGDFACDTLQEIIDNATNALSSYGTEDDDLMTRIGNMHDSVALLRKKYDDVLDNIETCPKHKTMLHCCECDAEIGAACCHMIAKR